MKKLNKKTPEPTKLQQTIDDLFKDDKSELNHIDEYIMECKTKCIKLSIDKKRKMAGFDFEYVYQKCCNLNDYLSKNNGSYSIREYKVIVGGMNEDEIKYKQLYVEDKIRLILEDSKTKPIEFFESYVKSVKHLKQEYKIHKNSQTLMHDDDDEIAIQASYNL